MLTAVHVMREQSVIHFSKIKIFTVIEYNRF